MIRLITLLIAILALIAGAGRTKVSVTSDCAPVSAGIRADQASISETPTEVVVSHVSPLEDDVNTDTELCETEPETPDCTPHQEMTTESGIESDEMQTEEKNAEYPSFSR